MPSLGDRYVNRSREAAAERERERQKKIQSWEALKAQVSAKYA